jgi:hypothetical protein
VRHGERERRDHRVELFAVRRDHLIAALHRTDVGLQRTEARVLERTAGRQHRLFAHHSRTGDALHFTFRVGDDPLTRNELRRRGPGIVDADVILEDVRVVARRALVGKEFAAHADANASGRRVTHGR